MKKTTVIIIFILCGAFVSPRAVITDYRDSYTGRYLCKIGHFKRAGLHNETVYIEDTMSIVIIKDPVDSVLKLVSRHWKLKAKLYRKNLIAFPDGGHYAGSFFAADSLSFNLKIGHASSFFYKGKKQ